MKRLFMFAIGILLLSGCSSTTTSDPFDSVYITNSECELGSDFNLIDTVSYNESVPLIFVSDDGGFDPNIAGTYDVTFAITDLKDRTTSKTFSYTVKDTTPPELILDKKEIHIKKGSSFNINEYASASDKSGNTEIKFEGELYPDKEGNYIINVYAKDSSNNQSTSKELSVIVGSRDNCIVRNAKFGDDKETVKEWEDAKSIDPSTLGIDDNVLVYETKLNGIDVYVSYYFNSSNKLTKIAYINTSSHINNQSFINDYDEIEESLEKKYGVPDEKEYSQNSSAKYSANEGDAIRLGNAMRYTLWNKDGYMIAHTIQSDDGLGILHGIQYEANDHEGTSINESDI